jgi:hypothetical protein
MSADDRDLLTALKTELSFLEAGGYWSIRQPSWRAPRIFEDGPTCPSQPAGKIRQNACRECVLAPFVPAEHSNEKFQCRYIPLNEQGQTLQSLYHSVIQEEIETVVANWLRTKIAELEGQAAVNIPRKTAAN